MVAPQDRTPIGGLVPPDSDQLTLGGLDAAAPELRDAGALDGLEGAVAVREPPVCGEWSFDTDEIPESRAGATFVATPVIAESAVSAPSPEIRRAPAISSGPALPPPVPAVPRVVAPRNPTPPTPLPAIDELRSIHDAHPRNERAAMAFSNALANRGNIEGALGALQRAIDAGASAVMLRCARATILSGRLRYEEAERELQQAQKAKPNDPHVLLLQGILACRRAKWREAVEPLGGAVERDPLSGQGHFYLGEALSKLDRLGEALEAYHRAAELEPDNWRAFKGVGMVLDRMSRPTEAAAFYRRARDGQRGT